jgi:elongation of very long chain fatty acids protein 4
MGGCVDAYFGVACNGAIHVLMYSYYALASAGVRCPWKRHLTMAQMAQFCACAAQAVYLLAHPACCPRALPLTQLWVMTNMLVLFGRFYVKQYSGKADAKKQALLAAARSAAPAAAGQTRARRAS